MRSVTNQPPTTFALASTIATKPITLRKVSSASPSTMIAPTMMMPWMKFVPDINGVWSIAGTFEITSIPRKIASTRIVSSITRLRFTLMPPRSRWSPVVRRRTRRR